MTESNLGRALAALGEREADTVPLEEAAATERSALEEFTRERTPLQWAEAQDHLGRALAALGQREDSTAWLQEAVAAYRAALEERTHDRVPFDWATTEMNLGNALVTLGERAHDTERLNEALLCFEHAEPVFRANGLAEAEAIDRMIGRVKDELAKGSAAPGEPSKPGG